MIRSSVDGVLADLASLKRKLRLQREPRLTSQKHQIQTLQMELGFLKMFLWCLPRNSLRKSFMRATVVKVKRKIRTCVRALDSGKFEDSDSAASKSLQIIEHCKQKMKQNIHHLSDCSFPSNFSSNFVVRELVTSTHRNLKNLLRLKPERIATVKIQIRALIKNLKVVRDFVNYSANECFFSSNLQVLAYKTARLSLMYWLDPMKEAMPAKTNDILNDLLQELKIYISEVMATYLRVLKASELSLFNHFEMVIIVEGFLNVLLPLRCMKLLQERLMFLITFLMYPPESKRSAKDGNLILTKAHDVAGEIPSLICSLTNGKLKEYISMERNVLLCAFQKEIDTIIAEVRNSYVRIPVSSSFNFPKTNVLGFIDSLHKNLGNLKETIKSKANFLSCIKHQIVILYQELHSVWPFLKYIQEKRNVFEEWMRIIDVAYQVEHLIDSCQILDVPIWYNIIRLSDVIEEIKSIKKEIQEIKAKQEQNIEVISATMDSSSIHLFQDDTSIDEVVVGFDDEAENVIGRLIGGNEKLDIVSIVGMPGQGKTTLAKKIYNDLSIRNHFRKCAWCFIGQEYSAKKLFLHILRDVSVLDDEMQNKSEEDLAHELCRRLHGKKYLIVLDDIWDISAWNELKKSFPDDNKGSRILFTSRNEILKLQQEFGSSPHRLRSLSLTESLELLNKKLFPKDGCCPSQFLDDVQKILEMCNGLPLAVVVIAGLLEKASNDLNQWRQIVRNLNSQLASEECMDILELSYKNLQDSLKPCFLSLAAVAKGETFNVQKLIEIWIAEGFVRGTMIERLNVVAMKYLVDLSSRSLIIVTKRSSRGEIKECRVHDLVRELCLAKAKEEKFLCFPDIQSHSSNPMVCEPYRICINERLETYIGSKPSTAFIRSLFNNHSGSRGLRSLDFSFSFFDHCHLMFIKLKFLRVLDMEGSELHRDSLHEITLLIFLRFLAITCHVDVLPLSIGNLCNLETFRLTRWSFVPVWLPPTFWRMKRLRNVHIQGSVRMNFDDFEMEDSSELRNLDSFSTIYLFDLDEAKMALRRLPSVRKLKLKFSRFWSWYWNIDLFDVLNSLRMLESVSMYCDKELGNMLGSCSVNFPSTLKKLTLSESSLPWSEISAIAKLPKLEVLKLLSNAFSGPQWEVKDDEFLHLKFLKLYGLGFSKWNAASSDSFTCIEQLIISDCIFLEEIPCSFREISTWKRIEIDWCTKSVANSARSILGEQQEMGNEDFKVVISNIYDPTALRYRYFEWEMESQILKENLLIAEINTQNRYSEWKREKFPEVYFRYSFLDEPTKRIAICNHKPEKQVQKTQDEYMRRVNNMHKHNCQSRQAILSRYFQDLLKRDG